MLYAITDRRLFSGDEDEQRERLLKQASVWAANGVAFIQLREKDLPACEQVELGHRMLEILRGASNTAGVENRTRLLINGRPDVALAAGADGVHLPSGPGALTATEVRTIFSASTQEDAARPYISVSCHTLPEVEEARRQEADCILFAPVFEKRISSDGSENLPGSGLGLFAEACGTAGPIPVFALGGVTAENAKVCLAAGAAGIAAIRLMHTPASEWLHLGR